MELCEIRIRCRGTLFTFHYDNDVIYSKRYDVFTLPQFTDSQKSSPCRSCAVVIQASIQNLLVFLVIIALRYKNLALASANIIPTFAIASSVFTRLFSRILCKSQFSWERGFHPLSGVVRSIYLSLLLLLLSEWKNSQFCIHTFVPHSIFFIVTRRRSQTFHFRRLYFHPVLYLRTPSLSLFPLLVSCNKFVETPWETPLDGSVTGNAYRGYTRNKYLQRTYTRV